LTLGRLSKGTVLDFLLFLINKECQSSCPVVGLEAIAALRYIEEQATSVIIINNFNGWALLYLCRFNSTLQTKY
jgi:hypothetical protein